MIIFILILVPISVAFAQTDAGMSFASSNKLLIFLYKILSNKFISSFLAGLIFASLIYILFLVRKPFYLYYALFSKSPALAFEQRAKRADNGTFHESYSKFRTRFEVTRKALILAILTLFIQILAFVILTLVILQVSTEEEVNAGSKFFPNASAAGFELAGGNVCKYKEVEISNCGNCGTRKRTCVTGYWGEYSSCSHEGECQAGQKQTVSCGNAGTTQKTCSSTCHWESSTCVEPPPVVIDKTALYGPDDFKIFTINGLSIDGDTVEIPINKVIEISGRSLANSIVILGFNGYELVKTINANDNRMWTATLPANALHQGEYVISGYFKTDTFYSKKFDLARLNIVEPWVEPAPIVDVPVKVPPVLPPPPSDIAPLVEKKSLWTMFMEIYAMTLDNPIVEQIALFVVLPLLFLLHFLLIIRGLGFWRFRIIAIPPWFMFRKKNFSEKFGTVFDFLTKVPLPWVKVKLFTYPEKKLKAVVITDETGKYEFNVNPGKYIIEASCPKYIFPSTLSKGLEYDGDYSDLYHQEVIEIAQYEDIITYDIPMDRIDEKISNSKILSGYSWSTRYIKISLAIMILAVIVSAIHWIVAVFLVFHLWLYVVSRKYLKIIRAGSFGKIAEKDNSAMISRAVIRAFDAKLGRFVGSTVSDAIGGFRILLGKSSFYLTIEKKGYETLQTPTFSVTDVTAGATFLKESLLINKEKVI